MKAIDSSRFVVLFTGFIISAAVIAATIFGTDTPALARLLPSPSPANDAGSGITNPVACDAAWAAVTSPNPGSIHNYLYAVDTVSTNDIWAVGSYKNSTLNLTLTEHWNGSSWQVVPSPNANTGGNNELDGVAAISTNDVWAVGYYDTNGGASLQTLIEHWNGSAWSVVSSPSPGSVVNRFFGVAAISSSDVWAVGLSYSSTTARQTLIEHWNGSAWSVVSSPSPDASYNELNGVAAISSSDVWAVGYHGLTQTLIEHWNGSAWSVVSSPDPDPAYDTLTEVAAVSTNDVWAVGYHETNSSHPIQTLTEHWNGSAWSVVPSPNVGITSDNELLGVAAISSSDVWAVGYSDNSGFNPDSTLTEHWNGSAWSIVPSPNPSINSSNILDAVAAISTNDVWAVGYGADFNGTTYRTLTEHWSPGGCSTPTSTATNTPLSTATGTATATSTPSSTSSPTNTPTQTATNTPAQTPTYTPSNTSTSTATPTSTLTSTHTPTYTPTSTPTNTPAANILVGHVTYQGIPQNPPNARNTYPITLTLCLGGAPQNFVTQTDNQGYFTATLSVPAGNYNWQAKSYTSLSNAGTLTLNNGTTNQEFGTLRGGDANNNNVVNTTDFNLLKANFNIPDFNPFTDFNRDGVVNTLDFNILKANFNIPADVLTCP